MGKAGMSCLTRSKICFAAQEASLRIQYDFAAHLKQHFLDVLTYDTSTGMFAGRPAATPFLAFLCWIGKFSLV